MRNVSIMMVVTHVNVMKDIDQRQMKHLKHGWPMDEITRVVLMSMNAKIAHSMIVILKQRPVFELRIRSHYQTGRRRLGRRPFLKYPKNFSFYLLHGLY